MKDGGRALLEAAARAAGYWAAEFNCPANLPRPDWNPLTSDGDALRLACHLRINIEHAVKMNGKAYGVNCWPVGRGDLGQMEDDLSDYNAATRRAIVRAAAEIGRSKT